MACDAGQLTIVLNICQKGGEGAQGAICPPPGECAVPTTSSCPDIIDPNCDPNNPKIVTFREVQEAYPIVQNYITKTPCTKSRLGEELGLDLYFKKDFLLYTGNFKERGACHTLCMLQMTNPNFKGAVSASAGNHAFAMAYHGKMMKINIVVVMPKSSPMMKIKNCKAMGATVIVDGNNMSDAKRIGLQYAKDNGMEYVNGFDHPQIIAGAGSIGLEVLEDVPDVDAILVPIGGGGLLAGTCVAMKNAPNKPIVIGVESDKCPGFSEAMKAGKPTFTEVEPTIAEGLAVPVVGFNSYATAAPLVDKVVVIEEIWATKAMLQLMEIEKAVVEGAGSVGLAAILSGQVDFLKGKRVVVVLSGGNVDTTVLGRCIDRALAAEGRLVKFTVMLTDKATGLPELFQVLNCMGVNVIGMEQYRPWVQSSMWEYEVTVVCESVDMEMTENLVRELTSKYGRKFSLQAIPQLIPGR